MGELTESLEGPGLTPGQQHARLADSGPSTLIEPCQGDSCSVGPSCPGFGCEAGCVGASCEPSAPACDGGICEQSTLACDGGGCEPSPLGCEDGGCAISCPAGTAECDGDETVLCEADLGSVAHCGGCGNACSTPNATPVCNAGRCEVLSCAPGFEDCDGQPENGCEAQIGSVQHCSACYDTCTSSEGVPVCNAGVCGTRCDLNGVFALKLTASGSWPESTAMEAGTGPFEFWLRVSAVHSGDLLTVDVRECGRTVPPEQNKLVPETMRSLYPNSLFDNAALPSASATVTLGSSSPGASISWPLTVTQLGISLASPATFSWPADAANLPAGSLVDMDGDGKPGVSTDYANGGGFIYPRTSSSPFSTTRADRAYLASRLGFTLGGSLTSCTTASGTATIPLFERGVLGCNRAGSTQDCNSSERSVLDTHKPAWTLGATTYVMAAVAPDADCAAVRAQVP